MSGTRAPVDVSAGTPTGNTYDKYATTNPIEQKMMVGFIRALDGMLDGLRPVRILEIGVGEGHVMTRVRERFPDASLAGLDLPDAELAGHWRVSGLPCMFGDATRLPFADGTFDLVMAIEVLEHVPGPERALRELLRVCSPQGALVASVPFEPIWRIGNMARRRYLRDLGNTPGHVNHWSRRSFARFIDTGFRVERVASPLPWTMVRATRR
jgi:ubiquinone/menaquinone biosynthesis C-methylase UbiE